MKISPNHVELAASRRLRQLTWLLLLISIVLVGGCARTVTGGLTDSPDKKFRMYSRVLGANGHAFDDNTGETVIISICANDSNQTLLLGRKYHVHGSDVGCDAKWDKSNNLNVEIADYGPGVDYFEARKNGTPERRIRS